MAKKFILKHPDGKFVHRGDDGEYFLQNGEHTAVEMTLPEFRKSTKYIKNEKVYVKGNLKFFTGSLQMFTWNGGTELEVIEVDDESPSDVTSEAPKSSQNQSDKSLEQKVQDWAFNGTEFNHNDGEVESVGELLYAQVDGFAENPYLIARRIDKKQIIQFRAAVPTDEIQHIHSAIRDGFKGTNWRGFLL